MVAQSADNSAAQRTKSALRVSTSLGGWVGSEVNVCKVLKLLCRYIYIYFFFLVYTPNVYCLGATGFGIRETIK